MTIKALQRYCCFLFLFFVPGCYSVSFAQGENNHWRFGSGQGLDFTATGPVRVTSPLRSQEGCAAVSDAAGNLLFYSNGNDVWDVTGAVMPNGSGLQGNGPGFFGPGSCTQGVAIVKSLKEANLYFLFVLDSDGGLGTGGPGYLRYSMVDMTLNSGRGDIVAGRKNIILDSFMAEPMVVAKGGGCNYWLLTHRHNSAEYHVFRIEADSIHSPVISTGLLNNFFVGELKLSPDGTKTAMVGASNTFIDIEITSFDANTGILSGAQLLGANIPGMYGTEFSPDGRKLYHAEDGHTLVQHDLSALPDILAVRATRTVITPQIHGSMLFRMRRGPDDKIYIAESPHLAGLLPSIGRINIPNATGAACNFDTTFIPVPWMETFISFGGTTPGGLYGFGFDNAMVVMDDASQTLIAQRDTAVCTGNEVTLSGRAGCNGYRWSDGSEGLRATFNGEGTYWVASMKNCTTFIDTIRVRFHHLATLAADTFLCRDKELLLDVTTPGAGYRWQDGSTGGTYTVTEPGTYSVMITKEGCRLQQTIRVSDADAALTVQVDDSIICQGRKAHLSAQIFPSGSYQWSNGSTAQAIDVDQAGVYRVSARNACGTFSAAVPVALQDCNCPVFIPNVFSPNGDGNNDVFVPRVRCQVSAYRLLIFNRFGEMVFSTVDVSKGWNGMHKGHTAEVGAYFFDLRYTGADSGASFRKKGDLTLLR